MAICFVLSTGCRVRRPARVRPWFLDRRGPRPLLLGDLLVGRADVVGEERRAAVRGSLLGIGRCRLLGRRGLGGGDVSEFGLSVGVPVSAPAALSGLLTGGLALLDPALSGALGGLLQRAVVGGVVGGFTLSGRLSFVGRLGMTKGVAADCQSRHRDDRAGEDQSTTNVHRTTDPCRRAPRRSRRRYPCLVEGLAVSLLVRRSVGLVVALCPALLEALGVTLLSAACCTGFLARLCARRSRGIEILPCGVANEISANRRARPHDQDRSHQGGQQVAADPGPSPS